MLKRTSTAVWRGNGPKGTGSITTLSGALKDAPYGFQTRFASEDGRAGTNPEELIAAAHASCFTMALSFALARAGFTAGTLETKAKVTLDKDGDGFSITRSDLELTATIDGIDPAQFEAIAADAKANCPVSKVLKAEITLTHRLNA